MRGDGERCHTAGAQYAPRLAQSRHVVVEVLDHLPEHDRVEP
jgi:hypothetical protein